MKARLTARVEFGFVGPTRSTWACNVLAATRAHDNDSDYTTSRRPDNKRAVQQVLDVCEESDGDRNRVHAQGAGSQIPISRLISSRTVIDRLM